MDFLQYTRDKDTGAADAASCGAWLEEYIAKPAYNSAVVMPYNAGLTAAEAVSSRHLKKLEPLAIDPPQGILGETAVTVSSAVGGAVPYVVAGKLSGACLRSMAGPLVERSTLSRVLHSNTTAMVVGAAALDGLRDPLSKETRFGNILGGATAFGVYGQLNSQLVGPYHKLSLRQRMLAQAGIGAIGGEAQLAVSRLASGESIDYRDLRQAALHGAITNLVVPASISSLENLLAAPPGSSSRLRAAFDFVLGPEPPPVVPGETYREIAQALRLPQPELTARQTILSESPFSAPFVRDRRGSMQLEKYTSKILQPDGTSQDVIVRSFSNGIGCFRYERFRHEQIAHHLNAMIGLENGYSAGVLRLYEIDGKLARGWVQEEAGIPLERALPSMAKAKYGSGSDSNVRRLVREDEPLRLRLEEAFVERFVIGDRDPNSHNFVILKDGRVRNIDLDQAFDSSSSPGITTTPAYGVNHILLMEFSNQPISQPLRFKLGLFSGVYGGDVGQSHLRALGLTNSEVRGVLDRVRWFAREGRFPVVGELTLM